MAEILTNGVTEILKKLVPAVAQEINLAWGVKDELKKLQNTMEMILAVVADAERRQVTEEAVRLWLRWLKDVAYDADDVIDEFSYETIRRCERGDRLKHKLLDFVSSSNNPLAFVFKMAKKIKNINRRLDEITKDMHRFQLQGKAVDTHGESSEQRSRQTASFINDYETVGRKDDTAKIVDILTKANKSLSSDVNYHSPEKVSIISIVGMGGLGKTTLAQLVYKDEVVNKYFDQRIWVCVSSDFDVEKILIKIMESVTLGKFDNVSNFDLLVNKVQANLQGKKFLLVLDDLWNENIQQWERLKIPLLVGAQGSKILITTRNMQVADVVKGSIRPYQLEKLQEDECWSIMEKKAFSPGGATNTPTMTNIGKGIAKKCSGLPLAAKFLGSLMHSKNQESEWLSIRESDVWNTQEGHSQIRPILKLSYDNLSPHLKQCFSYCSIFPKGWEIKRETLIHLWMAEGFLGPSSNVHNARSIEDIGEEYFDSLVWSSFLDVVEKNALDDITMWKMHDLVHDLGLDVVGHRECTVSKVSELANIFDVRRLHLISDDDSSTTCSEVMSQLKKLRTVIVLEPNNNLKSCTFSSNKKLRVLYFGRMAEACTEIAYPAANKLKHLRYIQISDLDLNGMIQGHDKYYYSKLYNLQTLVLSGCDAVQNILESMGSLKSLRFLNISSSDIKELPDSVTSLCNLRRLYLSYCDSLTTFPSSVTGLQYLKFLDMSFTPIEELPGFIVNLYHLQTLDVNSCKKLKSLPEYVGGLANLRIFNFRSCPLLEALPRDIGVLSQLRSLDLEGSMIRVLPEACGNLYNLEYANLFECEGPVQVKNWTKLRKIYYRRNMETPTGIGKLVWLQELIYKVREEVINEPECNDGIEELANLNFLEKLYIYRLENVKDPIDCERANLKGKQNLRILYLRWGEIDERLGMMRCNLQESCNDLQVFEALQPPTCLVELVVRYFMGLDLPTWMNFPSCLPNLEVLEIIYCKAMKQLPASIGKLPRLKSLSLEGMSLKKLDISGFPSLIYLTLTDMFILEELSCSYPSCLQDLSISGCKCLTEFPSFPSLMFMELKKINHKLVKSVGRTQTSLAGLWLRNIEELKYFPVSILQNNCNLQFLKIRRCKQFEGFGVNDDENENMVALDVPEISSSSLRQLDLIQCQVLKFLPDLRGWTSLQILVIFKCPQVEKSLNYDLKCLSFLKELYADFIQRDDQRGDPSTYQGLINLLV